MHSYSLKCQKYCVVLVKINMEIKENSNVIILCLA
jgi:hypothetical protein